MQHLQHASVQVGQNNYGVIVNPPTVIDLTNESNDHHNRITWTDTQLKKLEESFQSQRYPCQSRREALAQQLGCLEKNIKSWFQNRRVKAKKNGN